MKVYATVGELFEIWPKINSSDIEFVIAKKEIVDCLGKDQPLVIEIVVSKLGAVHHIHQSFYDKLLYESHCDQWRISALKEIVKTFDSTLLDSEFLDTILLKYSKQPKPTV